MLVETVALGVCGTDREIVGGEYGWAPPGRDRFVLGHEWIGRVREAPAGGDVEPGDLVAGIVRRPDPVPCACCARGEYDMCRNGRYRERGIKELDGYGAELVALEAEYAVRIDPALSSVGVLAEPASVVAKAWEQVDRVAAQACRPLERVLVTGAGPIGLLAALMGVQRGHRVHVLDRAEDGPKPRLAGALGAGYSSGSVRDACASAEPDIVIECTGAPEVVVEAIQATAPGAVVCLTGVSPRGRTLSVDVGALNDELVLENDVVLGSVNANRRHFDAAARALQRADRAWLEGLITRRVPLARWAEALDRRPEDIKAVIEFGDA
ncbi:MAG TPA: glucose 1-dehydrogenase [Solirubrobacteraceae bacterium]|nr:glucose 1-dehydrogenase [Solirubrobacteraceae bacterium]